MADVSICSEEYHDMFCERCDAKGEYAHAEGFCATCKDYLCKTCYKYHGEYKVTHILHKGDEMPKDFCFEKCTKHGKYIKFYCEGCESFACKSCKAECRVVADADHKHRWEHFPMFIKHNEDASESILNSVATIKDEIDKMFERVEEYKSVNDDCNTKAALAISLQRDKLNQHLRDIEFEFNARNQRAMLINETAIKAISNELVDIKLEIDTLERDLDQMQKLGDKCKLFVTSKVKNHKIETWKTRLDVLKSRNAISIYGFKYSEKGINPDDFGIFELTGTQHKREARHIFDINTKLNGIVNDICLLNESWLVAISSERRIIKVFTRVNGEELSSLKVSGIPLRLAKISANQVAATAKCGNHGRIVFFSVLHTGKLKGTCEIFTHLSCRGVVHYRGKLLVSYTQPENKVCVLDYTGVVIQSFSIESPLNVTLSRDSSEMYVSEDAGNRVSNVHMNGKELNVYKDKGLIAPRGLSVDKDGIIYVCGMKSNNIHYLTPHLEKIGVLLGEANGIKRPICICFQDDEKRLYVGMENGDIKVFEVQSKV